MRGTKFGTSRTLSKPIQWLLRDEFSDTRAAGSVNGTMAIPGPGARTAADSAGKMSIGGDAMTTIGGVSWGDPRLSYAAITRQAGQLFLIKFSFPASLSYFAFCAIAAPGTYENHGLGVESNGSISAITSGSFPSPSISSTATVVSGVSQIGIIAIRPSGHAMFWGIGVGNILLMYLYGSGTHNPIVQITRIQSTTVNVDFVRGIASNWLPTPLISDGFGAAFGTTDGLGHAEGVNGGIGSGGGNVALTQQVGTWANSAGKAAAATLSGGVAVATVPLSTADVFAKVKVTRSAGAGGLTLRWTDSSNYLYAEHDGTNAYLKQVLSGSTTTLITAAATYSAGAEIVVDLNGTAGRLYYNNALVGTTSSINSGLTATAHGIRSTDTGGIQLDDLCIYAKGTGGEYNMLNRYVNL